MRGSGLDLAIASAILAADGQIPSEPLADAVLLAELGLDGRARPVRGAVVAAVATRRSGRRRIVVARRKEKPTLSLDHGVRLTARRSTRRVRPSAANRPAHRTHLLGRCAGKITGVPLVLNSSGALEVFVALQVPDAGPSREYG